MLSNNPLVQIRTTGIFYNNDLGDKVTYNGNAVNITLTLTGDTLSITTATPS